MQYALHYTGVNPETGQFSFYDQNHDGNIYYQPGLSWGDDSYIVHTAPRFFGGLGMEFRYTGLSVNLFFNIKDQIGKNALLNLQVAPGTANMNATAAIFGTQWQRPGDVAGFAKFTTNTSQWYNDFQTSDGAYTDASFIRLSNLSVSYALPVNYLKRAGIRGCSLNFYTNNLFVITRYKGIDPETQNFGFLPPTKTIVGGINFNF